MLRSADGHGLTSPDVRALAASTATTTVAVRAAIRQLVDSGRLLPVTVGVYALPGSPAAAGTGDGPVGPGPRQAAHDAVHDGRGSTALW
jgi:hypothetical protein